MAYTATPLITFLKLYSKASYACYINHMEGAIALYDYLKPVELPEIPENFEYSQLQVSYEITMLSSIVARSLTQGKLVGQLAKELEVERAIIYSLVKDANL